MAARDRESASFITQRMAFGAYVLIALWFPLELADRQAAVLAGRLVPHGHMRFDLLVFNHPTKQRCSAVRRITHKPSRLDVEALFDPIDHGSGGVDLRCAMRRRGLHVHDDAGRQIDQIVGRVRVEGRTTRCCGPLRSRVGRRDVPGWCLRVVRHLGRTVGNRISGVQRFEVLTHRTAALGALAPLRNLGGRNIARAVRVGLDDAGIDGKSLPLHQSFGHAAVQHRLEDESKCIALAKAAMPVLGESGMVGHLVLQAQATEPPVG
ncbi:hypothetical protein D3C85_1037080 [compost metagenome]